MSFDIIYIAKKCKSSKYALSMLITLIASFKPRARFVRMQIDLSTDTAAILDSIVSDIYYGMLRGQIHTNLPPRPPRYPIITI